MINTTCSAILANVPTRSSGNFTLHISASASPTGLTFVQNNSDRTQYALFDSRHSPIILPNDITLPTGTALSVNAFTDLPATGRCTTLEVNSIVVNSRPSIIDADTDGDLLLAEADRPSDPPRR